MRSFLRITLMMALCFSITQCSSSSSSTDTTSEFEGASSAISALFGGDSSSASESLANRYFKNLFQEAFAVAGDPGSNCDEDFESEDSEGPNITFTQLGDEGTYGPTSDGVTIDGEDEDFCENGGDWSTYEFESGQFVQFDCSDDSTFYMTDGSGIWRETLTGTEVAGTFEISDDEDGTNGQLVSCHGIISDEESSSLDLNCVDEDGNEVTETDDLSCSTVED